MLLSNLLKQRQTLLAQQETYLVVIFSIALLKMNQDLPAHITDCTFGFVSEEPECECECESEFSCETLCFLSLELHVESLDNRNTGTTKVGGTFEETLNHNTQHYLNQNFTIWNHKYIFASRLV